MESIKQKRIAKVIQEALATVFQKEGLSVINNSMITISHIRVTPDLLIAKIYLSIYNAKDKKALLESIKGNSSHIKNKLAHIIRNHVRRIPELEFFEDETLDEVYRLEEIFKKINNSSDEK